MQKWEYTIIDCSVHRNTIRPRWINGTEIRDWKKASTVSLLQQLGNEGWELVSVTETRSDGGIVNSKAYYLKRSK